MAAFELHNLHFFDEDTIQNEDVLLLLDEHEPPAPAGPARADGKPDQIHPRPPADGRDASTDDDELTLDLSEAEFRGRYREVLLTELPSDNPNGSSSKVAVQVKEGRLWADDADADLDRFTPFTSGSAESILVGAVRQVEAKVAAGGAGGAGREVADNGKGLSKVLPKETPSVKPEEARPLEEPASSISTESVGDWVEQSVAEELDELEERSFHLEEPEISGKRLQEKKYASIVEDSGLLVEEWRQEDSEDALPIETLSVELVEEPPEDRAKDPGAHEHEEALEDMDKMEEQEDRLDPEVLEDEEDAGYPTEPGTHAELDQVLQLLWQLRDTVDEQNGALKKLQKECRNIGNVDQKLQELQSNLPGLASGNSPYSNQARDEQMLESVEKALASHSLRQRQELQDQLDNALQAQLQVHLLPLQQQQLQQQQHWQWLRSEMPQNLQQSLHRSLEQGFQELRNHASPSGKTESVHLEASVEAMQMHLVTLLERLESIESARAGDSGESSQSRLVEIADSSNRLLGQLEQRILSSERSLQEASRTIGSIAEQMQRLQFNMDLLLEGQQGSRVQAELSEQRPQIGLGLESVSQTGQPIKAALEREQPAARETIEFKRGDPDEIGAESARLELPEDAAGGLTSSERPVVVGRGAELVQVGGEAAFLDELGKMAGQFRLAYRAYLSRLGAIRLAGEVAAPSSGQDSARQWREQVDRQLQSLGRHSVAMDDELERQDALDLTGDQRWQGELQQLRRLQLIRHAVSRKMRRLDRQLLLLP